jgi:hypothetical protein
MLVIMAPAFTFGIGNPFAMPRAKFEALLRGAGFRPHPFLTFARTSILAVRTSHGFTALTAYTAWVGKIRFLCTFFVGATFVTFYANQFSFLCRDRL